MKEKLISFETAKLAKEKGFDDVIVLNSYSDNGVLKEDYIFKQVKRCSAAPTQALLQKWLRDEHKLEISIDLDLNKDYFVTIKDRGRGLLFESKGTFKTYENALEVGLQEALELITI
jgi:hypothetical protein